MVKRRNWIREELILAFNLYCKIPFGQYNQRNAKVVELAKLIGRSPGAVAFKLVNFASFDPYHKARGVSGLKNAGKLDKEIYKEFTDNWEDLIFESEILLKQKSHNNNKQKIDFNFTNKKGTEKIRLVKTRVNQSFFRTMVLANYANKCAVSEINIPELLIASHILPWSKSEKERLNPHNGICLSALYDKMFDKGLMSFTENYEILFSKKITKVSEKNVYDTFFSKYSGKVVNMPEKFLPNLEFLEFHRENIFQE